MEADGLGDWRQWAVSTLAKDLPAAYPGGPSHKAGAIISMSAATRDQLGRPLSFLMPSPTALALSTSIRTAKHADDLRHSLPFITIPGVDGQMRTVAFGQTGIVYDFLEACMTSVTSAFNAVEIFANQTIATELRNQHYVRNVKRGVQEFDSVRAQRELSIEEKLTSVLPQILSIASPEAEPVWKDFRILKRVRESTLHMKSHEAFPSGIDGPMLFHEFFKSRHIKSFPIFAVTIIDFYPQSPSEPRWLTGAKRLLGLNG
jgi:hypothetical protein